MTPLCLAPGVLLLACGRLAQTYTRIYGATRRHTELVWQHNRLMKQILLTIQVAGLFLTIMLFPPVMKARSATVVVRPTNVIAPAEKEDTLSKDRTFDITTWNVEWFGWRDSTRGPVDKQRQNNGVQRVLDSIHSDLYALQEVVSIDTLKMITGMLHGNYHAIVAEDVKGDQKLAFVYNRDVVSAVSNALAVNGDSKSWVNGRYPYRFTFNATIDGKSLRLVVFNIHAKATDSSSALADHEKRVRDARTFYDYLDNFYSHSRVIVVGDFNDELLTATVDSTMPSPYSIFVGDTTSWSCATCPLAARGLYTYLRSPTPHFIDNVIVSDEVTSLLYDTYVERPQPYVTAFSTTVSDHAPVTTRLLFTDPLDVAEPCLLTSQGKVIQVRFSTNPITPQGSIEIEILENASVTVSIVDALGNVAKTVLNGSYSPGIHLTSMDALGLRSGFYVLQITSKGLTSNDIATQQTAIPFIVCP